MNVLGVKMSSKLELIERLKDGLEEDVKDTEHERQGLLGFIEWLMGGYLSGKQPV